MKHLLAFFLLLSICVYGKREGSYHDSLLIYSKLDSTQLYERFLKIAYLSRDYETNLDTADLLLQHAYKIFPSLNKANLISLLEDIKTQNLIKRKLYAEAYNVASTAIKMGDTTKNIKLKIECRAPMISFYDAFKNDDKVLELYREKLKIARKLNDSISISNTAYKIAYKLFQLRQYEESKKLFQDAFDFRPQDRRKSGMMAEYIGWVGNISYILGDERGAIRNRLKAIEIAEKANATSLIIDSYRYLGNFYSHKGIKDSTLYYFNLSLKLDAKNKPTASPEYGYSNLFIATSLLNGLKDPKLANEFLRPLLKSMKDKPYSMLNYSSVELGIPVYKQLRDVDQLIYCVDWYFKLKDSLDKPIEISDESIQMKYDYDKQLQEKQLESEREIEKRKSEIFLRNIFVGFLVIAVVLLILVFKNYLEKKKSHKEIELQKTIVERKNQEILDSISYAKRIQTAILPPNRLIKEYLPNSFILYKPKDIVAGDFYWMEPMNDLILFAAADCTGHGVPGAMVSVICNNGLNRSVREFNLTDPGKILDKTREIVIQEFEKSDEEVKDGMDISLCVYNTHTKSLQWSGANNPIWIIRKNTQVIEEIKANKQPIGKYMEPKPFTTHSISLNAGDSVYVFTDGYQDQFGGERGKKFKASQMKELLLSIQSENMDQQKEILDTTLESWKGKIEQVDDICILGLKIS